MINTSSLLPPLIAGLLLILPAVYPTAAHAQKAQVSAQVNTIPAGTLVRVVLQRALDSTTMEVGDKVRVQVAPGDLSGLPKDCVLVGRVTEVAPATKTAPGVIDVYFEVLEFSGGNRKEVSIDLAVGNQPPVGFPSDGKATQKPNTKIIGYSAGAGA